VKAAPTARSVAWNVLVRAERNRAYADLALHAALRRSDLDRRDRALATELTYGSLRLRGRIDYVLQHVLDRDLEKVDLRVRNLLRLGCYQLLFCTSIRDAAAVSESVELAKGAGLGHAAGFVNAVLRQVAQKARSTRFPDLEEDPVAYLMHWGSLPRWMAERWLETFGAIEAAQLAETSLRPPPRTIRVSEAVDLGKVAKRLRGRPCRFAPRGVTELRSDPVQDPGFGRGEFSVQDEASQLVPLLLGAEPGDRVVDCCAAPGAKALQLAERVGPTGEVIAFDVHANRLSLIRREARRLGLSNLRVLQRDATQNFDLRGAQRFGRMLVDAPCSGVGVLRRNPDARWRLEAEDVRRLAENQVALLRSVARYLDDGGVLVYSVCSLDPEETEGVVKTFLETEPGMRRDDVGPYLPEPAQGLVDAEGALRCLPHRHGCDGFFAVRLVRA
jgi:16S rRNA (cytosine967-C5)-methyltransferase